MAGAFLVRSSVLSKELTDQSLELKRRSGELRQSYEELREAQQAFASITGEFTADDLLGEIFSRFCIGK